MECGISRYQVNSIKKERREMTEYNYVAFYRMGKYHSFGKEASVIRSRVDVYRKQDLYELCSTRSVFKDYSGCDRFWYKDGKKHRGNDLPAVIYGIKSRNLRWYENGKKNREDAPAYINIGEETDKNGDEIWEMRWYKEGLKHREKGPAVVKSDGTMEWYENGELKKSKKEKGFNKGNEDYKEYYEMIDREDDMKDRYDS